MIRSRATPYSNPTEEKGMARGRYSRGAPRRAGSSLTAMVAMAMMVILTFIVIILLAVGLLSGSTGSSKYSQHSEDSHTSHIHGRVDTTDLKDDDPPSEKWVEVISWEPRAFIYHNFLSKEECEHLIEAAKPHMEKSTVVDNETGKGKDSRVRTSSGTFLARGVDKVVRDIEQRIADFTFIPVENGEGLQVLHYEVGQKYEPHHDYFSDAFNTKNGGQRVATVLMYLTDVDEGGETVFPAARGNVSAVPWWNELSKCGKEGLSVLPKRGDALLFWSLKPDASVDPYSLHGGCPVIRGNKWSSTKWMRVNEYTLS